MRENVAMVAHALMPYVIISFHQWGGGPREDICFSAEPIGVGVSVGIGMTLSFVQDIS